MARIDYSHDHHVTKMLEACANLQEQLVFARQEFTAQGIIRPSSVEAIALEVKAYNRTAQEYLQWVRMIQKEMK